jgi:hypothetical protein
VANFAYNITKGRGIELYNRVKSNDPAASVLVAVPLSASGTEAEGQDYDDLAAVLAGTADERTTGGWVRKTWTDASLAAFPAPDDTNNRYSVQVPATTWTTPASANNTTGLLICYSATNGADSTFLPIGHFDFAVTTDGNDVILNLGDFLRAA